MKCPHCGSENLDNARTCTSCGAELPEQTQDTGSSAKAIAAKLPKVSNKAIIAILGVIVLVIILIAVIAGASGGKSGDYTFVKQDVRLFSDDESTTVFINGKAIKQTIDGEARIVQSSLDNSVALIRAIDDDETGYYILKGKKLTEIKDSDDWNNVTMSSAGTGIAYTVEDDDETTLNLYTVSNKKSVEVEKAENIGYVSLSPDGKSLVYAVSEEGDTIGYFFNGKKSVKLGKEVIPMGLSNGGKYIYATQNKGGDVSLYLYNKKGEKKNTIDELGYRGILFNEDHTQILYYSDNRTCISVNGKDGEKFFKESGAAPLLPHDTQVFEDEYTYTYPVDNFYNLYYGSIATIYQVTKKYDDPKRLATKVDGRVTLSEDASTIYYRDLNGDLRMVKTSWGNKGPEKVVTIAEDVYQYVVTSDGKLVYYTERNGDLYSAKAKNGKSKKRIAEDAEDITLGKGDILFIQNEDEELYYCSNGKKVKKSSVSADVDAVSEGYLGYIYIRADDEVYCTTGSKKPKKIFTID